MAPKASGIPVKKTAAIKASGVNKAAVIKAVTGAAGNQPTSSDALAETDPDTPKVNMVGVAPEILDQIFRNVIAETGRDTWEAIPRPSGAAVSPPYIGVTKVHPLLRSVDSFREAYVSLFFSEQTFSMRIEAADPGLLVFSSYLDSFGGYLPYVRILRLEMGMPLHPLANPGGSVGATGIIKIALTKGTLRVAVRDTLLTHNPLGLTGLNQQALMQQLAAPWVNMLRIRITQEQAAIEQKAGQTKDDWMGIREVQGSYTAW